MYCFNVIKQTFVVFISGGTRSETNGADFNVGEGRQLTTHFFHCVLIPDLVVYEYGDSVCEDSELQSCDYPLTDGQRDSAII